jgi:hypothetical protein
MVSCNNSGPDSEDVNMADQVSLPSDFRGFYDRFHSDSLFQISHIIFPLKGQRTMIDTMETLSLDLEYNLEDWKLHKPFVDNGSYERSFQFMGGLIMESMVDKMGLFTVERRWGKIDSSWNLIYYGTVERAWK